MLDNAAHICDIQVWSLQRPLQPDLKTDKKEGIKPD